MTQNVSCKCSRFISYWFPVSRLICSFSVRVKNNKCWILSTLWFATILPIIKRGTLKDSIATPWTRMYKFMRASTSHARFLIVQIPMVGEIFYWSDKPSILIIFFILLSKIEDVVKFPGLPQHKQLTYATKQLIAREVCCYRLSIYVHSRLSSTTVLSERISINCELVSASC